MGHVAEAEALHAGELIDQFTTMMLTQVDADARQEVLEKWEAQRRGTDVVVDAGPVPRICGPDALMHFALNPLS